MIALAAAFAGYFGLLIHSDLTRPEPPGFISEVHGAAMMLAAVAPDSPAARAGLQAGDRILTANGLPIGNRLDWLVSETNLQTGHPLVLEAVRGSQRLTAVLILSRVPAGFWATSAGITLLAARAVQLVTQVLAFVVILEKPFDPPARAGGWLLGTLAVYSIVLPYQIAATWRALPAAAGAVLWVPFASSIAVAAVLFTFFAIFRARCSHPDGPGWRSGLPSCQCHGCSSSSPLVLFIIRSAPSDLSTGLRRPLF
jgi:PDZ domain-containing protein